MKNLLSCFALFFISTFYGVNVTASDSFYCLNAIRYFEKKHNIPNNYLYYIAVVESGKWDSKIQKKAPWPWSLNVNGKTLFFKNKQDMLKKIKENINDGNVNMDIGCNQINYKHHRNNFQSIEQMINPFYNVEYSASYLHKNYKRTQNWSEAVAHYHSKNIAKNQIYIKKITSAAQDKDLAVAWHNKSHSKQKLSSEIYSKNKASSNSIVALNHPKP